MISIGAILVSLFLGLKYLMPVTVSPEQISLPRATFRKIYALVYLFWILAGACIAALLYFLLNKITLGAGKDYLYNLYPDDQFWIAVSAVTGMALGIIAMFGLVKLMLKGRFDDFWALYDQMYSFRATVILKVLTVLLTMLGLGLIVLGKNARFKISAVAKTSTVPRPVSQYARPASGTPRTAPRRSTDRLSIDAGMPGCF